MTIVGGATLTKTISVNLTHVSDTSTLTWDDTFEPYITTLESSVDTALMAYKSSTMNAQRIRS
jgi:hypothetical protein